MAPFEKTLNVDGRGEFMRLISFIARAIDTKYLHDARILPVIRIDGEKGKSLAADVLAATWDDGVPLHAAIRLPKADRMLLETRPSEAREQTMWTHTSVAGRTVTLAFNSDRLRNAQQVANALSPLQGHRGGVLMVSGLRAGDALPDTSPVLLGLHLKEFRRLKGLLSRDIFHCHVGVRVVDERLKTDVRFQTYWNAIDDKRNWRGFTEKHASRKPQP